MSELWWKATGISICGTDCQALQVMDMKVYTGEISPYLKPNTKVPLSLSFFFSLSQYINNNITHTEPEKKNPHIVQDSTQKWWSSHPSCVDPLPLAMLLLRQPASHLLDFSLDQLQDRLLWYHPTPISLPPTIPDSIGSPERNQKEGEVQETWALLTLCWQKARTVLFTLTRELNKIMSMVIPVAGENLDPGQARHAHLPGMHKPIRRERKWASGLHDFSFYSFSEHTASPL